MAYLLLFLASLFPAWADAPPLLFQAKEFSGFFQEGGQRKLPASCALAIQQDAGIYTVRLFSGEKNGVDLEVSEFLRLPLQAGVIPTFQEGLGIQYEGGVLSFTKAEQGPLAESRLSLQLTVDPLLTKVERASGKKWEKNELVRLPLTQTQQLDCRF